MNLFLTGTDTNVGKTYAASLLIRALRAAGASGGWLAYANLLAARAPAPSWATSGTPANWPKQWAQDVLPVAGSVYRQITHTTPGAQAGHWHVTVTTAFETSARELTDQQLAH